VIFFSKGHLSLAFYSRHKEVPLRLKSIFLIKQTPYQFHIKGEGTPFLSQTTKKRLLNPAEDPETQLLTKFWKSSRYVALKCEACKPNI